MPLLMMSSLIIPTARWVLPTPILPMIRSPVLSTGYSSTNLHAAITSRNPALGIRGNGFPARAVTLGTNFCGDLHGVVTFLSFHFAPRDEDCASAKGNPSVYMLWR